MEKWFIVGIGAASLLLSSVAMARVDIMIGVPGVIFADPVYPAPMYVAPLPVVYANHPMYYHPAPVRVQPRVVYPGYYRDDYYKDKGCPDHRKHRPGHAVTVIAMTATKRTP